MAFIDHSVLKQPCMKYERVFQHSDMSVVKLTQEYDDGTKRTKNCPIFTGNEQIEGLLYVEEKFRKIARQLNYENVELFDRWEECLTDNAESKWENQISGIAEADKTSARFDVEMRQFYLRFCDEEARDTMFEYLNTIKKPRKAEVREHSDRMEELYHYSNKLAGTTPVIDTDQLKKRIFKTFPLPFQKQYIRSRNLATDTLAEMIQFMSNEKGFADNNDKNKGNNPTPGGNNKRKHNGSSGGNDAKRIRGGGNKSKGKPKPTDPCPWHHGHIWEKCYDNPEGTQFRGPRGDRLQGRGGRGGGRGNFGGRGGNYGGRGNTNGGRGGGNYQTNQNNNQGQQKASYYQNIGNGGYQPNNTNTPAHGAPPNNHTNNVESHHFDQIGWGSGQGPTGNGNNVPGRW